LDIKNKRKGQTLEAVIYPVIVNIVADEGERIPSTRLWQLITDELEGDPDEKTPVYSLVQIMGKCIEIPLLQ
jgi:hypothetical protein